MVKVEQLRSITVPTWIVDGDHDEGIKFENTQFMAEQIPNSGLLIQPWVSHFSFLQNPQQFNNHVLDFMEESKVVHNDLSLADEGNNQYYWQNFILLIPIPAYTDHDP